MNFKLSKHAEEELVRRQIPRAFVNEVLEQPAQIIPERGYTKAYQSKAGLWRRQNLLGAGHCGC